MKYKLALLLAMALPCIANAQLTIDDFTSGPADVTTSSGDPYFEQTGTMLGGNRVEDIAVNTNPYNADASFISSGGLADFENGPGLESAITVGWGYDAFNGGFSGQHDVAANLSPYKSLTVSLAYVESTTSIVFYLFDASGNGVALSGSAAATTTPETVSFKLSNFFYIGGSTPFAWNHVAQISMVTGGGPSDDYVITNVSAVPEPMSLISLSIGAGALLARRKKRA